MQNQIVNAVSFSNNISYDNHLSQIYYEDFKLEITGRSFIGEGRNGIDYLVIFDSIKAANAAYYKKSSLVKLKKAMLLDMLELYDYSLASDSMLKSDIIEELLEITNLDYYQWFYNENNWGDLDCDFIIHGYSQGDAVKVLLVGNVEPYINDSMLTNLFYDSPISGEINIVLNNDNIDIVLHELDDFNEYDYYDKYKLIAMIDKHTIDEVYHDELINYLSDNLSDNLEYI